MAGCNHKHCLSKARVTDLFFQRWNEMRDRPASAGLRSVTTVHILNFLFLCVCLRRLHLQREFTTQILIVMAVSVWIFSDHSGLLRSRSLKVCQMVWQARISYPLAHFQ